MKLENLNSDVQEYLKHIAAAWLLAPDNGWGHSRLYDVLETECSRYGVFKLEVCDSVGTFTPIVDTDD